MRYMYDDIEYNSAEWRLFIDSSKNSLKAVILHVKNKIPAIPVAYSTQTKETYKVMEQILEDIDYNNEDHQWQRKAIPKD